VNVAHALARWVKHGEKSLLAPGRPGPIPDLTGAVCLTEAFQEQPEVRALAVRGIALYLFQPTTREEYGTGGEMDAHGYWRRKVVVVPDQPGRVVGIHVPTGRWNQTDVPMRKSDP
jgi:hypothetical protein